MLVCAHCGSGSIIPEKEFVYGQGWITRPKCMKCGRDKFVERENPAKIIRTELAERVKEEEKTMGKSGQCKFEGCDKVRLAGGYCYRHYKEVNGHPYKGGLKNHKGGNIEVKGKGPEGIKAVVGGVKNNTTFEKLPPIETALVGEERTATPLFQIFLDPELLEKLTARAKAEYRTPEMHAAYLIEKALEAGK
jgi:hypothetical protein